MARIVNTDNFDSDYPNEQFILGWVPDEAAKEIAAVINKHLCKDGRGDRYYKVVDDNYILKPGI